MANYQMQLVKRVVQKGTQPWQLKKDFLEQLNRAFENINEEDDAVACPIQTVKNAVEYPNSSKKRIKANPRSLAQQIGRKYDSFTAVADGDNIYFKPKSESGDE